MQAGEQGAEEVVQGDYEGVHPLFAVVHLEGGVLVGILGERQSWRVGYATSINTLQSGKLA